MALPKLLKEVMETHGYDEDDVDLADEVNHLHESRNAVLQLGAGEDPSLRADGNLKKSMRAAYEVDQVLTHARAEAEKIGGKKRPRGGDAEDGVGAGKKKQKLK